ncbi:SPOR domain-containing protein [Pseudorhodobacter sp. W20_MBD10_FR17]|uniref:SPOR domain-containing protein n=1 Tax=Pseudorhodobacter sp. W20_MBD10_FR17 TaxID=3240266 RepID=UPI003F95BFCB
MADVEFDSFDNGANAPIGMIGRTTRIMSVAGAATSIALVVGMGYWGYRLAVRDMTGVPVVRALEGPMRVSPVDPGGVITDHQGLSVSAIAAEGGASAPADELLLAPAPIVLSDDDITGIAVAAAPAGQARLAGLANAPVSDVDESGADMLQTVTLDQNTDVAALADAISAGVVPLSGDIDITLDTNPMPVFSLPKGALAQSPRPRARPFGTVVAAAAVAPITPEIDGKGLASGTRLVQLGAFDSEAIARSEWDRLSGKFSDLLADKTRIVQSAQSGGRTFYRLRALGFADEADSRRFCSALVAERAACIPVAVR